MTAGMKPSCESCLYGYYTPRGAHCALHPYDAETEEQRKVAEWLQQLPTGATQEPECPGFLHR